MEDWTSGERGSATQYRGSVLAVLLVKSPRVFKGARLPWIVDVSALGF